MKPTDGELIAAAHLTTAILQHASQTVPRLKARKFVFDTFVSVLDEIQDVAPAYRADFRAVVQAARQEDVQ